MAIHILIVELGITIPVLHIKGKLYLIGSNRVNCDLKRDQVMLRIGGGYEKFIEYVPKSHKYFERSLVVYMIKSGESLEWVIDALFNGKQIKNILKAEESEANNGRSFSGLRKS